VLRIAYVGNAFTYADQYTEHPHRQAGRVASMTAVGWVFQRLVRPGSGREQAVRQTRVPFSLRRAIRGAASFRQCGFFGTPRGRGGARCEDMSLRTIDVGRPKGAPQRHALAIFNK